MQLRKIAETANTIVFAWDPVPGAEGWLFYKDGVRVSKSFDLSRRTVKFSKPGAYRVQAINFAVIDQDVWPDAPQPLPYVKVAPRVAYKAGGSDARYCTVGQPGVVPDGPAGHTRDESGATYDDNGLCKNGLRSDGSPVDCPTSALEIDGRPYCELPTFGDPTQNSGSWLI